MVHNQNTVCVQYRLLQGEALELQVRVGVQALPEPVVGDAAAQVVHVVDPDAGRHEQRSGIVVAPGEVGRDLGDAQGWWSAVLTYNRSVPYGQDVYSGAEAYARASLGEREG
jgi:hypothetical protein